MHSSRISNLLLASQRIHTYLLATIFDVGGPQFQKHKSRKISEKTAALLTGAFRMKPSPQLTKHFHSKAIQERYGGEISNKRNLPLELMHLFTNFILQSSMKTTLTSTVFLFTFSTTDEAH
jgi:hypothetical protein